MDKERFAKLRKNEILRGHEAFDRVFKKSKHISAGFLSGFVNVEKIVIEDFKSPLNGVNFKVGFIASKKIFRKATDRNKIKRLLRESFRLSKNILSRYSDIDVHLILGLNLESQEEKPEIPGLKIMNEQMKKLLMQLNTILDSKSSSKNEIPVNNSD